MKKYLRLFEKLAELEIVIMKRARFELEKSVCEYPIYFDRRQIYALFDFDSIRFVFLRSRNHHHDSHNDQRIRFS